VLKEEQEAKDKRIRRMCHEDFILINLLYSQQTKALLVLAAYTIQLNSLSC
jgi:hypothetical protein